jgi:hypothetical protein
MYVSFISKVAELSVCHVPYRKFGSILPLGV